MARGRLDACLPYLLSFCQEFPRDMDHNKRFLLAMVLCGLIVLAWQYFFPPPAPDAALDPTTVAEQTSDNGDGTKTDDTSKPAATTDAPPVARPPQKVIEPALSTIETEKFKVSFSNQGAVLRSIDLIEPEQYQAAGDLLAAFPADKSFMYPFSISFGKGALQLPGEPVYEVKSASKDQIVYRHVDPSGKFVIERSYSVNAKHPYALDMKIAITNNNANASIIDNLKMTITGYQDPNQEKSFLEMRSDELESICHSSDDTERHLYSSLDPGETQTLDNNLMWGAINSRYFFWGIVPEKLATKCRMEKTAAGYMKTELTWDDFSVPPSSTYTFQGMIYAGPKDLDVLNEIGSDLNESVDYGIFTVLAKPMRYLLNLFYTWVHNWGLAIILLTFLIKILTWPFTEKSYANAERMKEIQPKLDEIRSKYENDQQRIAEETMKLFKENKFNPLGGCFPMLLQMPILYGLYVMIMNSVELYQADFILWYTDLSARDPYFVLPILMGIMMFVQQHFMTPQSSGNGPNQQAQAMMKFMPIMFTAFMLFLPSGLVLYYSLNLVLGVLQQWMIRRKFARRREAQQGAVVS